MTKLENLGPEPRKTGVTALYDHCKTVYNEMRILAREEDIDGETYLVYEGYTSKLFQQLELAVPYYTSVMTKLKVMGCVHQLRRGGGGAPSRWLLFKEPQETDFLEAKSLAKPARGKTAMLEQRVRDLAERVAALEVILSE